jgi:hypothetical protein
VCAPGACCRTFFAKSLPASLWTHPCGRLSAGYYGLESAGITVAYAFECSILPLLVFGIMAPVFTGVLHSKRGTTCWSLVFSAFPFRCSGRLDRRFSYLSASQFLFRAILNYFIFYFVG